MARTQDLNLLHALKYEPVLRACFTASSFKPHEVDEVLLETYARLLASGVWGIADAQQIGSLTMRTAWTAARELLPEKPPGSARSETPDGGAGHALDVKDIPSWASLDAAAVASIISGLSPQSREVLLLRKALRLRPHDIAERLHVSEAEVTRRMLVAIREYAFALLTTTGARP